MATENENATGAQSDSEGTTVSEKPSFMTAADYNKASTAREKKLLERFEKSLEEKLAKFIVPRQAASAEPDEADAADEEPARTADKTSQSSAPTDPHAKRIAALERQLTRERKEREAEKAEREAQAAKMSRDEERAKLTEALTTAGVDPKKVRGAVALLHTEDRRVRRSEEGRIVFVDENDDELDLNSGLKAWLSGEEGKGYLPARGAQGSGAEPTRASPKTGISRQKMSKAEAASVLARELMATR